MARSLSVNFFVLLKAMWHLEYNKKIWPNLLDTACAFSSRSEHLSAATLVMEATSASILTACNVASKH